MIIFVKILLMMRVDLDPSQIKSKGSCHFKGYSFVYSRVENSLHKYS